MLVSDFDFELPQELIARFPTAERRGSRLLVADAASRTLGDRLFADFPDLLRPGDLLVLNDTRVIRARLRGRKATGGRIEVLVERLESETTALAQVRASKSPGVGSRLELPGGETASVVGREQGLYRLAFSSPLETYLESHGEVPLPPYIDRDADAADSDRYQTVYARHAGAVAAPTAGLHFDKPLLEAVARRGIDHCYVTLHVGAGTFQPLRQTRVESNRLHAERVVVSEAVCNAVRTTRAAGGRVIAVGTTSVRALEAASAEGTLAPYCDDTRIFIWPGYRFRSVDLLLTNFHLPRSSLLILVSAFAGRAFTLDAYRHAVDARYRFFSYGDAMLISPPTASHRHTGT